LTYQRQRQIVKIAIENLNVVEIVNDAVELFLPMAEDKNITVNVQTPNDMWLVSDRRKLQRILGNLLDNAIKFTPSDGTINITVSSDEKEVR
jgi:signal transduction histidine kinase